jgi:phosphomannomutase
MQIINSIDYSKLNRKNRLSGTASELSPEVASTLGAILGSYLGGEEAVVISARDFRKDTRMISRAFNAGLISVGTTVFELHASSLPVLQFALRRFSAHAGVHFAAAHRSPEKINIRIFDQTSIELQFSDIFSDEKIKSRKIVRSKPEKIADILSVKQANDLYRAALSSALGKDILKEKNFSVVLDCALGPMSEVFPNILAEIGCNVLTLNAFKPEGIPESLPSPNSLSILSRTVVAAKADLGIAFDPSGSRVIFFDENGKIIDTQKIAAILIQNKMIGRDKGTVVLSETMWPLEDWLEKNNISTIYAHDSPGETSRAMQFHRALFGATAQGNYIHPTISNESEPFASTLYLLSTFARDDKHKYISTFIEQWDVLNKEFTEEKNYNLLSKAKEFFEEIYEKYMENRIVNTLYGLKIVYGERKSCHIFTTIIPDRVTVSACAEKQEDREEIMRKTLEIVESVDRDIHEKK